MSLVERTERAVVPKDILVHPAALKNLLLLSRDILFPMIEVCHKLIADDCRDVEMSPMWAYVCLIRVVLFPDEVEAYLLSHACHLHRVFLLDGLQRTCYGVRASPCL